VSVWVAMNTLNCSIPTCERGGEKEKMEEKVTNLNLAVKVEQENGQAGVYIQSCGYSQLIVNIHGVREVKEDPSGFMIYGKDGIICTVLKPRVKGRESGVAYVPERGAWVSDNLEALCRKVSEVTGEEIALEDAPNGYTIGTRDEEGNWWFGGCDPSNFISINDCGLYEWVSDYPERNKVQELSALKAKEQR